MEKSSGKTVETETATFNVVRIGEDSKVTEAEIESQPFRKFK